MGLVKSTINTIFLIDDLENMCDFIFQSLGANLVQIFIASDKRNIDHLLS